MTPDGEVCEAQAAQGTVTRHFRDHQAVNKTSTNFNYWVLASGQQPN